MHFTATVYRATNCAIGGHICVGGPNFCFLLTKKKKKKKLFKKFRNEIKDFVGFLSVRYMPAIVKNMNTTRTQG